MFLGRDITYIEVLQVEALASWVGLRTIVFNFYAVYTGSWRDDTDERFQLMKNKLLERLEEVLEADGVTIIFNV